MTQQQATTWIFVPQTTGAEIFSQDQTGEMTEQQAALVAEHFMNLFLDQIEEAYPDADIEIGQGNGISGVKVQDDHGQEDEIVAHIRNISHSIWESSELWSVIS